MARSAFKKRAAPLWATPGLTSLSHSDSGDAQPERAVVIATAYIETMHHSARNYTSSCIKGSESIGNGLIKDMSRRPVSHPGVFAAAERCAKQGEIPEARR